MKKNYLPISIDIANEKILLIGGGQDALKKLRILQRFDAEVEVLAPEVCDEIRQSGVKCIESDYDKKYLTDYLMVYSCLDDEVVDKQIVKDCREARVLVNIHDKPALCQFVSPAIYKQGNITVAVGSNGENVYESIRIRDLIKDKLQFNLG
ncbi:bifunctional precorrin-2 dehydrogenase/sirohydrochlorin ferrochelatase [Maribellus sp. YY47]|uniref:precorrin-2 dehydrogenase/sirohydrochlorin ferrochelatase family protein n=1 Tax=Maribellus sp. YY47 TaxID=2929486 RepID=UPI002000B484|nr:bifunctional precorrin-2 dehydrogenase/sirohydrochlorin ferrochelatase [Maribellus sp. YY47]MCK3684622.1 bifunctional precorrin-2 dehydrogenase/sirohydrochlorin ferrochelatase [Maribellus sp. YY47]